MTASMSRQQAEFVQDRRLLALSRQFLESHGHIQLRTRDIASEVKDFLLTIGHRLASSEVSGEQRKEFAALQEKFRKLLLLEESIDTTRAHHLTGLESVTIEKIQRERRVDPVPAPVVTDSVSAAKIQSLLQDQKDLYTKELESERQTQQVMVRDLTELTSILKDATFQVNSTVRLQNMQLDEMQKFAEENSRELESQKEKMKQSNRTMTSSTWSTFATMGWIVALFVATYIIIRMFSKPTSAWTCPNA